MTKSLKSVRAVFPDAELWEVGVRVAVKAGGWLAVQRGSGWIAAYEHDGTWYAPLPRASRSGGSHTSFARKLEGLHTPTFPTALAALEAVLLGCPEP